MPDQIPEGYGSIHGRKFRDVNANGVRDAEDRVWPNILDGWTINLYEPDGDDEGTDWDFVDSTVTSSAMHGGHGVYRFSGLTWGTYYTCEVMQDGWVQTHPHGGMASGIVNASPNAANEGAFCRTGTISYGPTTPGEDTDNERERELNFGNIEDDEAPVVTVDFLTTDDKSPELTGTVDDTTATVELIVDGNTYPATNNGDGTWTLANDSVVPDLADDTYEVVATATDTANNIGTDTTNDELTIFTEEEVTPPGPDIDEEENTESNTNNAGGGGGAGGGTPTATAFVGGGDGGGAVLGTDTTTDQTEEDETEDTTTQTSSFATDSGEVLAESDENSGSWWSSWWKWLLLLIPLMLLLFFILARRRKDEEETV